MGINVCGDSYEPLMLRVEDFDGLNCMEYTFLSNIKMMEQLGYDVQLTYVRKEQ